MNTELKISTIDDLRDFKYRVHELQKAHYKPPRHDSAKCEDCHSIADFKVKLAEYQSQRRDWLVRAREQDKKQVARVAQQIWHFKHKRKSR